MSTTMYKAAQKGTRTGRTVRFLRTGVGLALAVSLAGTSLPAVAACPSCFGTGFDGPLVDAIGLAMLALLGLIIVVFAGIIKFFSHMARRARMLESVGFDDRSAGDGHHQPAMPASYSR